MIRALTNAAPIQSGLKGLCSPQKPPVRSAVRQHPFAATLKNTAAATPPQQMQSDLFSAAGFETRMNSWHVDLMQRINDNRTRIYNMAVSDWQLNDRRCRELGLQAPPPPAPPQLETAQAKPAGWWMANGSNA